MKTFPSKVEWIAEHQNGDKCYYYPGTGWISARDGLVTGFDLSDVPVVPVVPEDATHVQFVGGKVQYVRHGDATCVDIWYKGAWGASCTLQKLPGTIVRIADGSLLGQGLTPKAESLWCDADDGCPTAHEIRPVEVMTKSGKLHVGLANTFAWKLSAHDIALGVVIDTPVRWRYAS